MNLAQFLIHFDRTSDAPDVIQRLRRFILDLAVRGKLVEQDSNDEPATKLLKRILGQLSIVSSDIANTSDNACPFTLPASWEWATIGEVAHVEMGQSPPSEHYNQSQDGVPFYQGKTDFGKRHPTPRYWCSQPSKLAFKDDILISVRAPVGPTNVASEKCCIGRGLAALRIHEQVDREFVLLCLKSFETKIASLGFGTTFVAINKKHLVSFPIPLAPFPEQLRIVAKVNELMSLCDRLEAAKEEQERCRDRLAMASLYRVNNCERVETFSEYVSFYLNNVTRLVVRPEQIRALRQSILRLAVRGRLVQQDSKEGSATELLKCIAVEGAKLQSEKNIRPQKSAPPAANFEAETAIPATWVHAYLQDLSYLITDGTHLTPKYTNQGKPFLSAQNVKPFRFMPEKHRFVSEADFDNYRANRKPERGDVLLTRVGAGIGEAAVIDSDFEFAFYVSICLIKIPTRYLNPRYQEYLTTARAESRRLIDAILDQALNAGCVQSDMLEGSVRRVGD
jgi:type I restriction enzyme S subunit